jgi:hypothetical protein
MENMHDRAREKHKVQNIFKHCINMYNFKLYKFIFSWLVKLLYKYLAI